MTFLIIFGFLLGIILLKISQKEGCEEMIFFGILLIVFNGLLLIMLLGDELEIQDEKNSNKLKTQYETIEYNNIDKNF